MFINSDFFKPKKPHKYGAKGQTIDDIHFPSIKEASRYSELKILVRVGEVKYFLRQPMFDLPGGTKYRADFHIFWADGRITIEDVKGHLTKGFIRAKKQVEALYPIEIEVV